MSKRVRGLYGKPLVKDLPDKAQVEKVKHAALHRAGKEAIKAIQREIRRSSWNRSPVNLLNSFSYKVTGSTLEILSDHPAAQYLNKGVKPHQMIYLERADRPIPIIKENGELIFRNATRASMQRGSWQHPGIKGKHFLDRGVRKAREKIKEEILHSYEKMIADIFEG